MTDINGHRIAALLAAWAIGGALLGAFILGVWVVA
jgi:hypothetical protein